MPLSSISNFGFRIGDLWSSTISQHGQPQIAHPEFKIYDFSFFSDFFSVFVSLLFVSELLDVSFLSFLAASL